MSKQHFIWRFIGAMLGMGAGFGLGYGIGLLGEVVAWEESTAPASLYILMLIIAAVFTGIMTKGWIAALVFFCIGLPCIGGAIAQGGAWDWTEFSEFSLFYILLVVTPFAAFGAIVGYKLSAKSRPLVTEAESYEQETAGKEEEKRRYEKQEGEPEAAGRGETRGGYQSEEETRFERKSGTGDIYYDILGVKPNATQDEIKRAYRQKMNEYHPDKFMNQPEWVRKEAEEMSKKLNEAYEALMKES